MLNISKPDNGNKNMTAATMDRVPHIQGAGGGHCLNVNVQEPDQASLVHEAEFRTVGRRDVILVDAFCLLQLMSPAQFPFLLGGYSSECMLSCSRSAFCILFKIGQRSYEEFIDCKSLGFSEDGSMSQ